MTMSCSCRVSEQLMVLRTKRFRRVRKVRCWRSISGGVPVTGEALFRLEESSTKQALPRGTGAFPPLQGHYRYSGLLFRKFQSSFLEKVRDEWFDFIFQYLFRDARDDEVIRITYQVYLLILAFSALLPECGYFLRSIRSRPSSAILARTGEMIPPCGVPSSVA